MSFSRRFALLFTCASAIGALGCTAVLGIEDTQLGTEDAGPPPEGQDYTCVGQAPATPAAKSGTFTVKLVDVTQAPVEGVEIKACLSFNPTCSGVSAQLTGADGSAKISVDLGESGFDGFLELSGTDAKSQTPFMTIHWYFSTPVVEDVDLGTFFMITGAQFSTLLPSGQIDLTRGHVTVATQDCSGKASSGVSYSITGDGIDAKTVQTYGKNQAFVTTEQASSTDKYGQAAIFNITPSKPVITTTSQDKREAATFVVPVQAGQISTIWLRPNL